MGKSLTRIAGPLKVWPPRFGCLPAILVRERHHHVHRRPSPLLFNPCHSIFCESFSLASTPCPLIFLLLLNLRWVREIEDLFKRQEPTGIVDAGGKRGDASNW